MKTQSLYRFTSDGLGIYEAIEKVCPKGDSRRFDKPDGSWLPRVGTKFPGAISFWTIEGLLKYHRTGLLAWHLNVLNQNANVRVIQAPANAFYQDVYQVICDPSACDAGATFLWDDFRKSHWPTPPPILTSRLILLRLQQQAPEKIIDYFFRNSRHLEPFEVSRPPGFLEAAYWESRIKAAKNDEDAGSAARFTLHLKDSPAQVIGVANLTQISYGAFKACYLGYSLDVQMQGKGYMHEALSAVLDFAFQTLGLHRVQANYLPENKRSAKLLQGLGFEVEGLAKEYLFIAGSWRDHVLTSRRSSN